jgi:hypothetical protein
MNKKLWIIAGLLVIVSLAIGAIGASWAIVTHAATAPFQAASFDMTVGGTGTHEASGVCGIDNWAPGDPPVVCRIALHNAGSIPINVVWSGFALNGDPVMANNVYLTEFSDSTGSTTLSDLGLGSAPVLLAQAAPILNNGYFSNGGNTHGIFIPAGGDGYVQLTLAFSANAGNDTIGKSTGFVWTLTAMQTPVNSAP